MVDINQATNILTGLLVVISFILVIAYFMKKIKAQALLGNKSITIASILSLGNKERLILLEIANQQVLVGITAHTMQSLLVLNKVNQPDAITKVPAVTDSFQEVLRQQEAGG